MYYMHFIIKCTVHTYSTFDSSTDTPLLAGTEGFVLVITMILEEAISYFLLSP